MDFPTDRIYKFTAFSELSISALADQSAWFSSIKNLNDPFEGFSSYIEPKSESERITRCIKFAAKSLEEKLPANTAFDVATQKYLQEKNKFIKRIEDSIQDLIRQQKDFLESLCVYSTSVDIPSYPYPHVSNMLMWSHYGNGFSGFCMQFSAREFYNSLRYLNKDRAIAWSTVNYASKAVEIDPLDYFDFENKEYGKSALTKHERWDYEGELRFLSKNGGLYRYSPESLQTLYIGSKMPQGQQKIMLAIVKAYFPSAKVKLVSIHPGGYQVFVEDIV